MSLKVTVEEMRQLLRTVTDDLAKATTGNKAASQRVRVTTVDLEKAAKKYRKESISAERSGKGKPAKKAKVASKAKAPQKPSKLMSKPAAKSAKKPIAKVVKPAAKAVKKPVVKMAKAVKKPVAKMVKPIAKAVKKPMAKPAQKPSAKHVKAPVAKKGITKPKSLKSIVPVTRRPTAKIPRKR